MNPVDLRRRQSLSSPGDPTVVQFSPAPEAALPLMPRPDVTPVAALEFKVLLTRFAPERDRDPELLSVHTLRGRLDQPVSGLLGPRGEYALSFVPRRAADSSCVLLESFRFASAKEARPSTPVPEIALALDLPYRIEPPMEPETGGALVLQITAHSPSRLENRS